MHELGREVDDGGEPIDYLHGMQRHVHLHKHGQVPGSVPAFMTKLSERGFTYSEMFGAEAIISRSRTSMATRGLVSTSSGRRAGAMPIVST